MNSHENEPQGPLATSVERLRKELDHWLEAAFSQGGRTLDRFGLRGTGRCLYPAVDVIESPEAVEVYIDLPGVSPQSINLTLVGNMLTVEAHRAEFESAERQTVHVRERLGGKIARSIPMPAAVDPEKVTANAIDGNGTLHVHLEKSERAIPRQIQVNAPAPPAM